MAMINNLREPPFRFIGHGMAIAEALVWNHNFRGDLLDACRALGGGYVVLRCLVEAFNAGGGSAMFITGLDVLIFELLASVVIPYFLVVHSTKIGNSIARDHLSSLPRVVIEWLPVVLGLCVIGATYSIIDENVDELMSQTVRNAYQ